MVWDGIKRFRCPLRGWLAVLLPEQIGNLPGFGGTRRDVGPHRHDGKMNILRFQYREKAMRQVKQPGFADAQRQILRVGLSGKHPAVSRIAPSLRAAIRGVTALMAAYTAPILVLRS